MMGFVEAMFFGQLVDGSLPEEAKVPARYACTSCGKFQYVKRNQLHPAERGVLFLCKYCGNSEVMGSRRKKGGW